MNTFDFSPLYRTTIGFDRLASLLNSAVQQNQAGNGYPPYNIEVIEENNYTITLAVAGFRKGELDINTEKGVLTVQGKKQDDEGGKTRQFLYQGIATRAFERKFQLADHVEVTGAKLEHGLLTISLKKELPEAMKPKHIAIDADETPAIEHEGESDQAA